MRDNMLKALPQSISFLLKLKILDLGSNDLENLVGFLTVVCYCRKWWVWVGAIWSAGVMVSLLCWA